VVRGGKDFFLKVGGADVERVGIHGERCFAESCLAAVSQAWSHKAIGCRHTRMAGICRRV
jgi:hypothetical protein